MARIRTIKPEFWTDEKMSLLDPVTRLVYLGLISQADDAGRVVDNVKLIDGLLFPNTDDTSRESLEILARLSRITRYVSKSGQSLIQIAKWTDHQRVDHPNKYVLPGPEDAAVVQPAVPPQDTPPLAQSSRGSRESVASVSRNPRDTIYDQRPTTNDLSSERKRSTPKAPAEKQPDRIPAPVYDSAQRTWTEQVGAVEVPRFRKTVRTLLLAGIRLGQINRAIPRYARYMRERDRPLKLEWFAEDIQTWLKDDGIACEVMDPADLGLTPEQAAEKARAHHAALAQSDEEFVRRLTMEVVA